ncbi:MAG: excinuclease ABC subunit UvrC, partial [Selenomonadaceae bacterium]|nr:excinuclease ABC subunit UvrC [Selenomonadaceae bacterium]
MNLDFVQEKLRTLPNAPGVYIMKDARGKVIYVGKAVVLKNRVRQYFQPNKSHGAKVKAMVAHIADFETFVTANEVEALILECNLIKKYRPRYNISLKDDKSYPYLKLTLAENFPRIILTRRVIHDGSRYFGPYTSGLAVKETLQLLRKIFPLRTCTNFPKRPCLEFHIKRCLAPCADKISREDYMRIVNAVEKFLEGRTAQVERELAAQMNSAAEVLNFERAAHLRDVLLAVRKVTEKQKIVSDAGDVDAIGLARLDGETCAQIFFVRDGKVIGRENFQLNGAADETDAQAVIAFIKQYYSRAEISAAEILLPVELPAQDVKILSEWLGVKLRTPQRGVKHELVDMANQNAAKFLAEEAARQQLQFDQTFGAVEELQTLLKLPTLPRRIECFDISHIQGAETVASMVVFADGVPDKRSYRRFKIHSAEGKPDDFLSMREVTSRRYFKMIRSQDDKITSKNSYDLMILSSYHLILPDLIVIDGGLGQLNSALEIIRGAGLKIPVVGLAKQFELIFVEGSSLPIELPRDSQALKLVQRLRDEAHRFAITYHRKLRRARNLKSALDNVAGIGVKRRTELLKNFGSLEKIKSASIEELLAVPSMT